MNKIYNPADEQLESFKQVQRRISVNLGTKSCRVWDTWAVADSLGDIYGKFLLEVGAWNTFSCVYFAGRGAEVHATDSFSWANREYAKSLPPKQLPDAWREEVIKFAGVTVEQLDVTQMRVTDRYDGVYAISTIEHIVQDLAAVRAIFKALKPGGIFAWTTEFNPFQSMKYHGEPYCYRVYNLYELVRMTHLTGFEFGWDLDLTMSPSMLEALYSPNPNKEILDRGEFTQISLAFKKPGILCES